MCILISLKIVGGEGQVRDWHSPMAIPCARPRLRGHPENAHPELRCQCDPYIDRLARQALRRGQLLVGCQRRHWWSGRHEGIRHLGAARSQIADIQDRHRGMCIKYTFFQTNLRLKLYNLFCNYKKTAILLLRIDDIVSGAKKASTLTDKPAAQSSKQEEAESMQREE